MRYLLIILFSCLATVAQAQAPIIVGSYDSTDLNLFRGSVQINKSITLKQYGAGLSAGDTVLFYLTNDLILRAIPLSYVRSSGGGGSVDSNEYTKVSRFLDSIAALNVKIAAIPGTNITGLQDTVQDHELKITAMYLRLDHLSDSTKAAFDSLVIHRQYIELNASAISYHYTRIQNLSDSVKTAHEQLLLKEPAITPGTTGQYLQGDKTWQPKSGLPISTATQAALDGKISYSDTTTIVASQDYVNNAIADIPIIDSSRYVLYSDTARSGSVATYPYVDSLFNEVPPLVDSSRYVLYGDSNIVYVTPTQLDEAIADIPPLDTSNIVARIDSNANSINILDSTAYIGKPVNVQRVMLEGQSNCDGSDVDTTSLTTAPLIENQFYLLDTFERVYTWDYTNNVYKKLKAGYSNYGRTGASFGAELSYAARWEKNNPDGILVIDKKCLYGQTIDQFQKGTTQYTTILNDRPLADKWLTDRGYRVKNTAWVFIQGESDLDSAGYQYLAALNELVTDKFSDGLIDSTTRLVISQVSTSAPLYGAGVDSAQVAFVNAAPNRKLINNDANTLGVGNHYNAAGYVQLGLSAYTQSFDADSLKTLDQFMYQHGVGTVIGELRVEQVEGDASAAEAVIGVAAALVATADNFGKVPLIVASPTTGNSSMIWFVSGSSMVGNIFSTPSSLLYRSGTGKGAAFSANNRTSADVFIQSSTGNVGINTIATNNPLSKLHVVGSIRGTDTFHIGGNVYAPNLPRGTQDSCVYIASDGRYYKGLCPAGGLIDSIRISNDSLYQCVGGTCTFVGVVNSGGGSGTVTSFTFTDGNGFDGTVTNSTTTPTLSIDLQADHNLVSDAELANFTAAYNDKINSAAYSAGQLTLTQQDAGTVTATINDATTSVKGIASFNASDFDVSSGAVSTDYTNGQAASGSTKGFLTSTDWTTFNNKQSALGFTAVPDTRTVNGQALSSNVTLDIDDVAPAQTGNANKILTTDGTNATWQAPAVGVTVNTQTGTTYTILSSDNGKIIEFTNSSAVTVTLPSGLGTTFTCIIRQNGTGDVTLDTSGTTVHNANSHTSTRAQYSAFAILPTGTANTFITQGDMD